MGYSFRNRSDVVVKEKEKWHTHFTNLFDIVANKFYTEFYVLDTNATRSLNSGFTDSFIFDNVCAPNCWMEACAMEIKSKAKSAYCYVFPYDYAQ